MSKTDTHLILGFTGGIGRAVALALSNRNIPAKAMVRDPQKANTYAKGLDKLEIIEGDAMVPEDVDKAMQGVNVVYYCINIPYPVWEKYAIKLFYNCLSSAIKNNVKIFFPGNVYVYGHARYNPVNEFHPHAAHTNKGQIRMEMEEMMVIAHKDEGLDYTIVRMPDFYGPYVINTFSERLYILALQNKKLQWIGNLDTEIELIYIEDGGEAMVMAALKKKSSGEIFNIPGSEITTARKYLTEIVHQAGSTSKISTFNSEIMFKLMGLFSPMIREVHEMLYLKKEKLILDGSKFKDSIGPIPATSYTDGIKNTLSWVKNYYGAK
jgi:nucleoside-diphosphate-sugar epimerase